MKGQIQAMQEEATAKEKAIKEANQRISDLEKNIKEMQKLLELKNQNWRICRNKLPQPRRRQRHYQPPRPLCRR